MTKEIFPTLLTLVVASLVATAMIALRWIYSGFPAYLFLLWNLFLAWLPLLAALAAPSLRRSSLLFAGWSTLWLLFLPNAPYLLTDLMHLGGRAGAPLWYDLMLLLTFGFTGLLLGFVSLNIMHGLVSDKWGRVTGWTFAVASLTLSSVGVYIGRFLRWNSWDALTQPQSLALDLLNVMQDPWTNKSAYVFSFLLAAILAMAYVILCTLPRPSRFFS